MRDDVVFAANHLAVAAIESPNSAAGADIHVVNSFRLQFFGAANVVNVVGVAAVDQDIASRQLWQQVADGGIDHRRRNHQPNGARLLQFLYKIIERSCAGGAFAAQLLHACRAAVIHHAGVVIFLEPSHHVGTHPPQTDHSELHSVCSCQSNCQKKIALN